MRVSMHEFVGDVEALSEKALLEPLSITEGGEDRLVLLSAEAYAHLKKRERRVLRTEDWTGEDWEALARSEVPSEYAHLDAELEEKPA